MKRMFLLAPLAVVLSAMAQTQPNKARVFVSAMTHPGRPITTGPLAYQYEFDRALEREVSKKYTLIPSTTNVATVSQLLKQDGTYWVGGSFTQGVVPGGYSAYAAKPRHDFPMNEAKNCAAKDTPEQCAAKAFTYVDEIIREDNGWVKPPDTIIKYYTENVSTFLHYTDGATRLNIIVTGWSDYQEGMVCARIENGADKWMGQQNLGAVVCQSAIKHNIMGDGPWFQTGDFVQPSGYDESIDFKHFFERTTSAAIQTFQTWGHTNFSDSATRPIQDGAAKDWADVLAAQQQYIDALQKVQQEQTADAPARLAELQKQDQALTQRIADDNAQLHQLDRPKDRAAMLAALQGANAEQGEHISQDSNAATAELTQVQAQEKTEQVIIANDHASVNAMRPADFPVPGRKTIPPTWEYRTTADGTPEAIAAGIHGSIQLSFIVDDTGHPDNITVIKGLGYGLNEKAVAAMQGAVFHPALENGKPVSYEMQMFVNY